MHLVPPHKLLVRDLSFSILVDLLEDGFDLLLHEDVEVLDRGRALRGEGAHVGAQALEVHLLLHVERLVAQRATVRCSRMQ